MKQKLYIVRNHKQDTIDEMNKLLGTGWRLESALPFGGSDVLVLLQKDEDPKSE